MGFPKPHKTIQYHQVSQYQEKHELHHKDLSKTM